MSHRKLHQSLKSPLRSQILFVHVSKMFLYLSSVQIIPGNSCWTNEVDLTVKCDISVAVMSGFTPAVSSLLWESHMFVYQLITHVFIFVCMFVNITWSTESQMCFITDAAVSESWFWRLDLFYLWIFKVACFSVWRMLKIWTGLSSKLLLRWIKTTFCLRNWKKE